MTVLDSKMCFCDSLIHTSPVPLEVWQLQLIMGTYCNSRSTQYFINSFIKIFIWSHLVRHVEICPCRIDLHIFTRLNQATYFIFPSSVSHYLNEIVILLQNLVYFLLLQIIVFVDSISKGLYARYVYYCRLWKHKSYPRIPLKNYWSLHGTLPTVLFWKNDYSVSIFKGSFYSKTKNFQWMQWRISEVLFSKEDKTTQENWRFNCIFSLKL